MAQLWTTESVSARRRPGPEGVSPPAARVPGRRWRDWRLVLGTALVLGSGVAGALLLDGSDASTPVWAARTTLVPGTALDEAAVTVTDVTLDATATAYLAGAIPDGYVVSREVRAGELVPASAVVPASELDRSVRHVSVEVRPTAVPGRLSPGDRVDVWVADGRSGEDALAERVAAGVAVAATGASDGGLSPSMGTESVVLVLDAQTLGGPAARDDVTARLVAASVDGAVVLTLDPGRR